MPTIAEDSPECTRPVQNVLKYHFHEISHTIIAAPMPEFYKVHDEKYIGSMYENCTYNVVFATLRILTLVPKSLKLFGPKKF